MPACGREKKTRNRHFMSFYFDSWEIFNCFCEFTMEAKLVAECQSEKVQKINFRRNFICRCIDLQIFISGSTNNSFTTLVQVYLSLINHFPI